MISGLDNLLFHSTIGLPVAFASWTSLGEAVVVSERLRLILNAPDNLLEPYEFAKAMHKAFGAFLNTAVDKVSNPNSSTNAYSLTIDISGIQHTLKLSFDKKKQVYVFILDKKQSQEKSSEQLDLEEILDSLPIYIWQKNKDLKLTYCNKSYAQALETTPENAVRNNLKLIPPSRKDAVYIDQGPYLSKPKKLTEHVVIDGARRLLSIEESPFSKSNKSTGVAIDITEKETIEKNYKNYKRQTEDTLDNIPIPIAIFDETSTLVFANQAVIKLFDLKDLDLEKNCKFSDIIDYILSNKSMFYAEDIAQYKETLKTLFQKIIDPYHKAFHLTNGKTLNVTISPNSCGGLSFMFEDVTEKIELERAVNSIHAIQNETLEHLSEGIMVFGSDNRIKIINKAITEFLQIPESYSFSGVHISDFFESAKGMFHTSSERELWVSKLINAAAKRVGFSEDLLLTSGKTVTYKYVPLPEGLNLIKFLDVTDQMNLAKSLKEKSDLVTQTDKLKSNLISNISYELRAPLQTILGFNEILCNKYFGDLNDRQLEYCYEIARSVSKLTEIVDAIISLANIESGQIKIKFTEVNLSKFIKDLIFLFSKRAESQNVTLKSDFDDENFNVFIDEKSMKQACFQLISLAFRVTPIGGEITLSVELSPENPDYFNLVIKDNGIPFNEEELEKIQSMLLSDSDNGAINSSIEFGQILANSIVRLHNGKMQITSKENEGTRVSCCVPIKQFLQ